MGGARMMTAAGEIIVVVPTERESTALRLRDFLARLGVRLEHCGVGMAECAASTAAIIAEASAAGRRPRLMVLAGIAGSYSTELAIGQTVVVESETVADLGRFSSEGFTPLFQKEYTSKVLPDGFRSVRSNTINTAGWQVGGAKIENMEGAAFMAVCARFGVSAMEVRTISNLVGEPITPENLELSVHHLAEAVEKILAIV